MNKKISVVLIFTLLAVAVLCQIALAQYSDQGIASSLDRIIDLTTKVLGGALVVIGIIFVGIRMSMGDQDALRKGIWVVVGGLIIFLAKEVSFKLLLFFIIFMAALNTWMLKFRNTVSPQIWVIPLALLFLYLLKNSSIIGSALNYAYGVFYTIIAIPLVYSLSSVKLKIEKLQKRDLVYMIVPLILGYIISRMVNAEPIIFFYILGPIVEYGVGKSIIREGMVRITTIMLNVMLVAVFYYGISSMILIALIGFTLRELLKDFKGILGDYVLRLTSLLLTSLYVM